MMVAQYPDQPPILGLAYNNFEAGKAIFEEWRENKREGDIDIVIVTGIDSSNPYSYSVIVGPTISSTPENDVEVVVIGSRINTITPANPDNLNLLLDQFRIFGYFYLCPARMVATGLAENILGHPMLRMNRLEHREAWTIGENDPAIVAISIDMEPIIPEERAKDAPILNAIERKKRMAK